MADLDRLIEAVLDDTASPEERAALAERLSADPEARRRWWAESSLRCHLRAELMTARSEISGRRHIVQRRTSARARRRRRAGGNPWLTPLAIAALLLAALTGWWWLTPAARSPVVTPAVAELNTDLEGDGELRLADGSVLTFHEARYRVEVADGSRVALLAGRVEARIAQRTAGHPLIIATPHGEATIVGTVFSLATDGISTLLRVETGLVRFAGRDVVAGEARLAGAWGAAERTLYLEAAAGPTLAQACARLGPGDVVVLGPGTHQRGGDRDAMAVITVAATAERPARILVAPGSEATLSSDAWDVLHIGGDHLVLSGLHFVGRPVGQGNGLVLTQGSDLRLVGCRFEAFGGDGMNARNVDGLRLDDCDFVGNGARSHFGQGGLTLFRGAGGADSVIHRVRFRDNRTGPTNEAAGTATGGHGLFIGRDGDVDPGGSLVIERCAITGNQGPGLAAVGSGRVTVRDCRILANGSGPVDDLRAQITATGESRLTLTGTVLAADPGTALIRCWEAAVVEPGAGNQVWGGLPPGPGYTVLPARPGLEP